MYYWWWFEFMKLFVRWYWLISVLCDVVQLKYKILTESANIFGSITKVHSFSKQNRKLIINLGMRTFTINSNYKGDQYKANDNTSYFARSVLYLNVFMRWVRKLLLLNSNHILVCFAPQLRRWDIASLPQLWYHKRFNS